MIKDIDIPISIPRVSTNFHDRTSVVNFRKNTTKNPKLCRL